MLNKTYTWLWVMWITAFFFIEGAALMNKKPGDTLSAHVWEFFSVKGKGKMWVARRMALLVTLAALVAHFIAPDWLW